MPGNSSRIIELEVTSKMESMLSRIKGIEKIQSLSGNGWGRIEIKLNKHVNVDAARFEVSTIIRQLWPELPQEASYPVISMKRSDNNADKPFMTYTINAPSSPLLIQQFTENQIKTQLAQIEGIDRIDVHGAMPMVWQLEYDFRQLENLQISISDLQVAIDDYLKKEFLGTAFIENNEDNKQWIRIALVQQFRGENHLDLSDIWVKNLEGKQISLSQLVKIQYVEEEAQNYYRINGLNSIYLYILAEDNANQLGLSKRIKEKLHELESIFPAGYELHLSYDATDYITEELNKIYFRSGLTLLILLLFVLLIYRNLKYLLLIVFSLLINIMVSVILYYLFHLEMQLYSLAGITISMTLVIDNTIVMSDQILRQHNMKAFLAILTATLTTIASLVIIFFMDEKIRLNLQDFACVIIINLSVSLLVALFLVPAVIEKLHIRVKEKKKRRLRLAVYFSRFYTGYCRVLWQWKAAFIVVLLLGFGLPVFLLPEKIEEKGNKWATLYNETFGSVTYKENIKPSINKALGGTLRLFVEKVYSGSYFTDREETSLLVTSTLPNGSTIAQMNDLIQRMESYLSNFPDIKQFQTNIENARRANIRILFTKDAVRNGFPFILRSKLISKSIELGGGSWGVYGLGDGFSNDVRDNAGSYQVEMYGFNYDELLVWADRFKMKLLERQRIKDIVINSEFSYYKDDYEEFSFEINKRRLIEKDIQPVELFAAIKPVFGRNIYAGQIYGESGLEKIVLSSKQLQSYDIWNLQNIPVKVGEKEFKLSEIVAIRKIQAPQQIAKVNQEYRLCLQYEYIGAYERGKEVLKEDIGSFVEELPMGYRIENKTDDQGWKNEDKKQYLLLLIIFVIIYFTTSVLFNDIKQPFYVIFVIPIAYIGVFLIFYLFDLNFDQGGFAAFVLLCGISVNSNIYVLNEYNNIRTNNKKITPLRAYVKAWNAKISPIFLTVISTILGFFPFIIGENHEAFWFPLAVGTIGGLIMSLVGLFCYLPLFMGVGKK